MRLSTAFPLSAILAGETNVDLVHERRRLEGVPPVFAPETLLRKTVQFLVHERQELVDRASVARAGAVDEIGDVIGIGHQWSRKPETGLKRPEPSDDN